MDKYEVRRLRLQRLVDERCGGVKAVAAAKVDRNPSYISRLLSEPDDPNHRKIGDTIIDIFEAAFQLPRGWFDAPEAGEEIDVPKEPITERERVMLELFGGLTKAQQDELIRRAQDAKQLNQALIEELVGLGKKSA
jgi:hypothetical protein